jgi:hypothetical protein
MHRGEAAADEVNNFQAVAFVELSFGPTIPRHDFAIEFNGDAVGLHAKRFHERGKGEWGWSVAEVALVSVKVKFHCAFS